MNILALEFSSAQRSVAVNSGEGEHSAIHELTDSGGKGTRAFSLIENALSRANLQRREIDTLAVALGPGSYTGIRVAISIAQGWQLATGLKVIGVSTADVLAAQAQDLGLRGDVDIVIDAQRGELYWARYTLKNEPTDVSQPLRLARPDEVKAVISNEQQIIGPEATTWFPGGRQVFPSAAMLASLALARRHSLPAEKLEPVYLRETTFVKAPLARIL